MAYEVLARKWRPQLFEQVIGQDHITQTLTNAIKNGRLAHAYLFGGPRGVGKTSVARILAKAINCEQGTPGVPCNQCQSCIEITDGSSVDVQEIDGASNRGIDEIRELRDNTKYMPASSRYRIYIIDEVHMLTKEAFNALLKTLEEPPEHVKFIFATTESHKVPVTILSRCQRFDFKRIPPEKLIAQLEKIARTEGIQISRAGLALLSREAEGSMRDAESLLDQVVSFAGPRIDDSLVTEILGIIDADIISQASRAIIEGSPGRCLEIVSQIYTYGYDIKEFYKALMDRFRDLLVSLVASEDHLLDLSETEREEAKGQAETAGQHKLQVLLNFLIKREEDLRYSSHPRLILETTMIKMCQLGDFLSFSELLDKLESLEKRLTRSKEPEGAPPENRASDPGARWRPGPQEEGEDLSHSATSGETWNAFLTFLSSESKPLYNVLKDWELTRLTEEALELSKGARSFSSTFFEDPVRRKQLSRYCREFFQRDLKITLLENNHAPLETNRSAGEASAKAQDPLHSDLPSPVQDILHMFQGEIRDKGHADVLEEKEEV
jgi:DNA polymerase-3 subunit gamma/tau